MRALTARDIVSPDIVAPVKNTVGATVPASAVLDVVLRCSGDNVISKSVKTLINTKDEAVKPIVVNASSKAEQLVDLYR